MALRKSINDQLAEVFIPNSTAAKKSDLDKAREVLQVAKSLPRKVRRAANNECQFWRELMDNKKTQPIVERDDNLLSANQIYQKYGISTSQ